jgi:signal peptidase I
MKNFFLLFLEIVKMVIIVSLIVVPVRYFIFQPFFVKGESMEPNFRDGDYLIVDQISYRFTNPQRGEVIILKYPENTSQRYIKRIVGLPGERVEIEQGNVIIYQENKEKIILNELAYLPSHISTPGIFSIELPEGEYFVLGDNRPASVDSRRWGLLPRENIIGRVLIRAWPPTALAKFEAPAY